MSASGLLVLALAGACQVNRGDLTFDDDAFSDLDGMGGDMGGDGDRTGDGDGDGDGDMGGQGGAPQGELPQAGIYFDTADVDVGEVALDKAGPVFAELTDVEEVSYPYDARNPAASPAVTTLDVRMSCSSTTHDITANPTGLLLHDVQPSVVWPGALLQGRPFARGELDALPVAPESRQPMSLSVRLSYGERDFVLEEVEDPSGPSVAAAVAQMIESNFDDGVEYSGTDVRVHIAETKDVARFLLGLGQSARFGTAAELLTESVSSEDTHHTMMVQLELQLFEVDVHPPSDPEEWFGEDFFGGELLEFLDADDLSEENPPLYVSTITYGRMLTFAMTSTASPGEMTAALEAAAESLEDGSDFSGDAHLAKILEEAEFSAAPLGGRGALPTMRQGNWGSFFSDNLRLSTAVPLRAELKNLIDNSPAGVTETRSIEERHCTPMMAAAGSFDFGFSDGLTLSDEFESIEQMAPVDLDGDGTDDLVLNHLNGSTNLVSVIFGGGSELSVEEEICQGERCDLAGDAITWDQYQFFAADFTGDQLVDLLWVPTQHHIMSLGYSFHLLRGTEDGFARELESTAFDLGGTTINAHPPLARDMNGDGVMDVIYSFIDRNASNQTLQDFQIILADPESDEGPFSLLPWEAGPVATDTGYPATPLYFKVHDMDLDGDNDLLWTMVGQVPSSCTQAGCLNVTMYRFNSGLNPPEFPIDTGALFLHDGRGWGNYLAVFGDFNGDSDVDTAYIKPQPGQLAVHQSYADGAGIFEGRGQSWPAPLPAGDPLLASHIFDGSHLVREVMNPNGDAPEDVVVRSFLDTNRGTAGELTVNALGVLRGIEKVDEGIEKVDGTGFFQTDLPTQVHPISQDWSGYQDSYSLDLNGDVCEDVVWIHAESRKAFVAYGKPNALN